MRWFLIGLLLLVLAGAGAAGAWFLLQPKPTKYHPEFGTDCDALLEWAIPRWDPARIPGTDLPANPTGEVRHPFVAWRPPPR